MNMYFIALIPPPGINEQVLKWKEWVKAEIGAVKAMNSPGHITLVPPFRIPAEKETELIKRLDDFASNQKSFPVQLENFSHFQKRTIYLKVSPKGQLDKLRVDLFGFLNTGGLPIPEIDEGFSPHVTIAFRDLKRNDFGKAWAHFSDKKFRDEFVCKDISLLRHNKKNWEVIYNAQFAG